MRRIAVFMATLLLAATAAQASVMWASSSPGWGTSGPEIFQLDTGTGQVVAGSKWAYSEYNWIMDVADAGDYLYASMDLMSAQGNMAIAKISRSSGTILSTTYVSSLLGTSYSHINALEMVDGKLYGVENSTWDDTYRGNVIEMALDAAGDVMSASVGAFVGIAPDGALDFVNGTFYASSWKSGGNPGESWIATIGAADVGDASKSFAHDIYTTPAKGLMSGWQYHNGEFVSVSWQNNGLYGIDPVTGVTETKISSISGLSSGQTLSGLDRVIPEPTSFLLIGVGLVSVVLLRRRRRD